MIKKCSFDFAMQMESYRFTFQPKNKGSFFEIMMKRSDFPPDRNPMFILYAKNQLMESYPVLSTWNFHINQFREFVAKYEDLSFMVIENCDFFTTPIPDSLRDLFYSSVSSSYSSNWRDAASNTS